MRVGDIMRRGDRNAVAPMTLSVKEALLLMTRARSGSVSVVDARGRLVGVFTDGDLRRHMAEGWSCPVRCAMSTRKPVSIREDSPRGRGAFDCLTVGISTTSSWSMDEANRWDWWIPRTCRS